MYPKALMHPHKPNVHIVVNNVLEEKIALAAWDAVDHPSPIGPEYPKSVNFRYRRKKNYRAVVNSYEEELAFYKKWGVNINDYNITR